MSDFERSMAFLAHSLGTVVVSLGMVGLFSLILGVIIAGWVKGGRIVIKLIRDAWHEEVKIFKMEKNGKVRQVK